MPENLVNKNIIILSPSEWSQNAVSNMHIAAHLSKSNKVIYLETIGGRFPKINELGRVIFRIINFFGLSKDKKIKLGLNPENVIIESPLAIPIFNTKFFDSINKRILLFQLRNIIKKYELSELIIWCFSPKMESHFE